MGTWTHDFGDVFHLLAVDFDIVDFDDGVEELELSVRCSPLSEMLGATYFGVSLCVPGHGHFDGCVGLRRL